MTDPTPTAARRWRPSRRTGLIAGGVAVLAVAVGLAVGPGTGDRGDPGVAPPGATSSSGPAGPRPSSAPAPSATGAATPLPDAAGPTAAATDEPPTGDAPAPGAVPAPTAVPELPPVPLTREAEFGTGVVARLAGVVRVDGQGQGLGEDSGPALAVTVEVQNGTGAPLDLSFVAVTLVDDAGDPGQVLLGDPRSAPFSGPLAAGGTAVATYVLRLPSADPAGVTVTVSYGAEAPTAVFTGPVPAPAG